MHQLQHRFTKCNRRVHHVGFEARSAAMAMALGRGYCGHAPGSSQVRYKQPGPVQPHTRHQFSTSGIIRLQDCRSHGPVDVVVSKIGSGLILQTDTRHSSFPYLLDQPCNRRCDI